PSPVKLTTKPLPGGGEVRTTSGGQVREKVEKKPDGQHVQQFAPTGRVQREIVEKKDGSQQTTHYAPNGQVQRTVVTRSDGAKETTNVRYDRGGKERATETIKVDTRGREISKTVVVKQ